ncbi:hypothetical protein [Burkholderia gladioli]|uniref:hypothetical protein n=1 Tax=Burkholderia gladioli TaxID=28095 RepID=UPI00163EF87A|nr:hypothetical protein [Burkholderia gladioli]
MAENSVHWEKTVEWAFVRSYLPEKIIASPLAGNVELSDALLGDGSQWLLIEFKRSIEECTSEKKKYPKLDRRRTKVIFERDYKSLSSLFLPLTTEKITNWWKHILEIEELAHAMAMPFDQPQHEVFKIADRELESFVSRYRRIDWQSDDLKEPHYLVFPRQTQVTVLEALPYWSEWCGLKNERSRGVAPFDARKIWDQAVNYAEFCDYVVRLARARGYPEGVIHDDGGSGSQPTEPVVFGYVVGQTKSDEGEWVVMTLREFYEMNPQLVSKLVVTNKGYTI